MNEPDKINIRLLSILSYIGPLFIIGKLALEKDDPDVKFHTTQGSYLCYAMLFLYGIIAFINMALVAFFPAAEILGFLLYVGATVGWFILACMGISSAIHKQKKALPFIGEFKKNK